MEMNSLLLLRLLLMIFALLPGLYFLYLISRDPWTHLKKRRKLHEMAGNEWIGTQEGAIAISLDDSAHVRIYLYKVDE